MTRTSAADYPTLGFDPTPGDTYEVSTMATTLSGVSGAMTEISNVLHGADDGEWRGKASIAFRDLLDDDLRPKIDKSCDAFGDAYRYVSDWSTDLWDFQSRARTLERSAASAQQRADSAQAEINRLPDKPAPWDPEPEGPDEIKQQADDEQQRTTNNRSLSSANAEVEGFRSDARKLQGEYNSKGQEIARLLKHSIDIAPNEPGWLDRIGEAFTDFVDDIGEAISDLTDMVLEELEKIAPLLKTIGDLAAVFSTVLGLLALIPGLQILALPALVLGGIALTTHYLSAAGESGSFLEALTSPDVIMDAVGLVLGGASMKLGGKLLGAARASGNTKMVPSLVGPATEIPAGFFDIARGTVTEMNMAEMQIRLVKLHVTYGQDALLATGAEGNMDTLSKLFTGDFGPMTQKPSVVR